MSEHGEQVNLQAAWGRSLRPAICPHCDWSCLLPEGDTLPRCPHCFRAALAPLDEVGALPYIRPPEVTLPTTLTREALERRVSAFADGIPLPPEDLNAEALRARLQALYLPLWLVDAEADALWQCEAGFDYEVVSHQSRYSDARGGWAEREVQETRARWEPRVGRLHRTYQNIAAPALEEYGALRKQLGRFDRDTAQAYRPEVTDNALVRLPNRRPDDAWLDAKQAVRSAAAQECREAMAAEHVREFRWTPTYPSRNWTLLLLPVYTTFYLDDEGRPQPVLLHGQTGQVSGARRASMKRARKTALIIAAVAAFIFVLSVILALLGLAVPPLVVVGGIGIVGAILVGLGALVPIARVWQFNRSVETLER